MRFSGYLAGGTALAAAAGWLLWRPAWETAGDSQSPPNAHAATHPAPVIERSTVASAPLLTSAPPDDQKNAIDCQARHAPVESYYAVVFSQFALTPAEKARLLELLRSKEEGPQRVRERLRKDGRRPTQSDLLAEVKAENAVISETYVAIRRMLGENRFRRFREQETLLPMCNTLERVEEHMRAAAQPLTAEQTQKLIGLFVRPKQISASDRVAITWQITRNDGSLDCDLGLESRRDAGISTQMIIDAHAFLSLEQIEALRGWNKSPNTGER